MKTLTIKKITIDNFKNIKHLEQELGQTVTVYGANETGKTTFADAISWCLTGKNSLGEANPNIIPGSNPESSPSVLLEVELAGDSEVKTVTLQREYAAKFNKAKEYTGEHQVVCRVNSVKSTVKEFDTWIDTHICNREIFRLVHDVRYFAENLVPSNKEKVWEIQRRLLFSVCGVKSDIELAKKRKKFAPLLDNIGNYDTANQYLAYLKANQKAIITEIAECETKLNVYDELLAAMPKGLSGAEIEKQIDELSNEGAAKFSGWKQAHNEWTAKKRELTNTLTQFAADKAYKAGQLQVVTDGIKSCEEMISGDKIKTVCSACGAALSAEKIAKQKATAKEKLATLKEDFARLREELNHIEAQVFDVKKQLDGLTEPEAPAERNDYAQRLLALKEQLAKFEEQEKYKVLVAETENKRAVSVEQRSYAQSQIDLCRELIDYKCEQATKSINDKFNGVTFELFRQNKTNDEVRECCDIYWQGIPYAGLSYSAKFIVGLNIALAFQQHYGVQVPLIVDNAESIDFNAKELAQQVIMLIKKDEICPECGGVTGRKQADGKWYCQRCTSEVEKALHF